MADGSADFTLRLKNQVTGPARAMSRSIRGLSSDLRDKQRFFAQGETSFQKKLKESRRLADRSHRQELRQLQQRRSAVQRTQNVANRLAERRTVGFQRGIVRQQEAVRKARMEARRLEGLNVGGGQGGGLGAGLGGGLGVGFSIARAGAIAVAAAALAAAAAATVLAAKFTSATIAAVDFGQRSKTALTSILKDGSLASQQFGELRREAGMLGIDVMSTVDQFKLLANAGFDISTARDLTRMSADLQALTGSSQSAEFALRAITQIKMKGRLMAEEINQQLAEHGVSADAVYNELGRTLGKTRDELLKMQKAGEISADVAIPAILQAVRNQLGVEQSGGFAMKINTSSVGGMWRTLKGQVQNAFISLGEQVGPGITRAFQSIMASIQAAVASPQVAAMGQAVVELFNAASTFVQQTNIAGLLKEAATALGTELTAAANFIRNNGAEMRDAFVRFVVAMGTGLQMAVSFFKPFVAFATSDFGKFMFTPLNETFGSPDSDAVKESQARMASARGGSLAAAQAGAGMAGNKFGDIKFGDINVNLTGSAATPDGVGGETVDQIRRQMNQMLQDL